MNFDRSHDVACLPNHFRGHACVFDLLLASLLSRPLDEGKKVKEKFDAIFNATMYIKALEAIKVKRSKMKTRKFLEHFQKVYFC